ncbi:hypothetical protein [Rufibacter tibetensis]|uniref:Uncharacterized protein n=1 Tax=Rufibacter tibetensis TaxID=512763 RepID=A0A0P0CB37_9BACT|nr:hypothetical protein [Rufibacter tibetensis]ALI98814.1 hypothetical protein DC20_07305 [Rufibacter tibetensis]
MEKETLQPSRSFWRTGLFAATASLFLLGACEAKQPADQEAKDRDEATDITEDADPDSTVESPATTGYLAPTGPNKV